MEESLLVRISFQSSWNIKSVLSAKMGVRSSYKNSRITAGLI